MREATRAGCCVTLATNEAHILDLPRCEIITKSTQCESRPLVDAFRWRIVYYGATKPCRCCRSRYRRSHHLRFVSTRLSLFVGLIHFISISNARIKRMFVTRNAKFYYTRTFIDLTFKGNFIEYEIMFNMNHSVTRNMMIHMKMSLKVHF